MSQPERCPACGGKIAICGGCKKTDTECAILALKRTGYDPTFRVQYKQKKIKKWLVTLSLLLSTYAYGQCCKQADECIPWNPILGTCVRPCICPTPSPTPTPPYLRTGKFLPMPKMETVDANYVQGPSAIKLQDGIFVVLDWGSCCKTPLEENGGEVIGRLWLPWGAGFFYKDLMSTHTLGTSVDISPNYPHEAAYPSIIQINEAEWWIVYSSTLWPIEGEKITVGALKMGTPFSLPFDVKHVSSFVSQRNAWSPVLIWDRDGRMRLYTDDLTLAPDIQIIKQWMQSSQTIGAGSKISLSGGPTGERGITDVAIDETGKYYALVNQDAAWCMIALYKSTDGSNFSRVSEFRRPNECVFDGGFTRYPNGTLVRPMLIFANSVSNPNDPFKDWRLVWFAEDGAFVPAALTTPTPRPVRPTP